MFKIIIALISNGVAAWVADYFIEGFEIVKDPIGFAIVVILFAVANSFVLPIVRFILKPLVWLTLGLLALVINGGLIYIVDILFEGITISGLVPLLLATIVFGVINATIAYGARAFKD